MVYFTYLYSYSRREIYIRYTIVLIINRSYIYISIVFMTFLKSNTFAMGIIMGSRSHRPRQHPKLRNCFFVLFFYYKIRNRNFKCSKSGKKVMTIIIIVYRSNNIILVYPKASKSVYIYIYL